MSAKENYERRKLNKLKKVNNHISIALSELSKIAGGTYPGSLRELKDLIKAKLLIEQIALRLSSGLYRETKRYKDD